MAVEQDPLLGAREARTEGFEDGRASGDLVDDEDIVVESGTIFLIRLLGMFICGG